MLRADVPFEEAFKCMEDPTLEVFKKIGDDGFIWLQNIVLERILMFKSAGSTREIFKILVFRRKYKFLQIKFTSIPSG